MSRAQAYSAYGPEPKFEPGTLLTDRQVADAATWHNYMSTNRQARAWLLEWLKDDPRLDAFKKVPPGGILPVLGFWAKLELDGSVLPSPTKKNLDTHIDNLISRYGLVDTSPKVEPRLPAGVQDLLGVVKRWATDGDLDRSLTAYLAGVNIPRATVKKFVEVLHDKKAGDPDLVEFLDRMKSEAEAFVAGMVVERKARAKKVVPPEKRVAGLKYMQAHNALQSVDPTQILGAKEVFLFNVTYNVFTHLVAADGKGLDVKGAAIINVDEKKSTSRNGGRRKHEILAAGVPVLRRIMSELTTAPLAISGRVGPMTLILKVHK